MNFKEVVRVSSNALPFKYIMPRIFDNIELKLLPSFVDTLKLSHKSEYCVGYFNLRGWKQLLPYIEGWTGTEENQCKLLIGMNESSSEEDLINMLSFSNNESTFDKQQLVKFKHDLARQLREQLSYGTPTHQDEMALRQLVSQLKTKKLVVKLFIKHKLHAKLYLLYRNDPKYDLGAIIISISKVQKELPNLRRYQIVLIDESHSLRNKKARQYKSVLEYVSLNDSKCILLSATPYNKTYHDLSNQLKLFFEDEALNEIVLRNLYNEKSGILDKENDSLAYIDMFGNSVTESQLSIFKMAECLPPELALERHHDHHNLTEIGVKKIIEDNKLQGGELGRKTSPRFRVYDRMKSFFQKVSGEYLSRLEKTIDDINFQEPKIICSMGLKN